jgi:hypothetical protein
MFRLKKPEKIILKSIGKTKKSFTPNNLGITIIENQDLRELLPLSTGHRFSEAGIFMGNIRIF